MADGDINITPCQLLALSNATKKSKIHQKSLMHLIKNAFYEKDIDISYIDKFEYYINTEVPIVSHGKFTFEHFLAEPVLKSCFEIQGNASGDSARKAAESRMFHRAYDTCQPYERPKYASLNISMHPSGNPVCAGYGSKVLIFKNDIKRRSTFMWGDSFNGQEYICTFQYPLTILYHLSLEKNGLEDLKKVLDTIDKKNEHNNLRNYIEVQMHGRVDISKDVEKIIITRTEYDKEINDVLEFQSRYPHVEIGIIKN